jgi:2-amino-4-hydroxy-6-hydroxymethyldihydropteridine diphosphokinase
MNSEFGIRNSEFHKYAIVALGSNLGRSREAIQAGITHAKFITNHPILRSSIWETTPVDCPSDSPKFLNAVVAFIPQKDETPETLLAKMQDLEKVFGRAPKKILNEPRPLDLDLIAFGTEIRSTPQLTLPHPRAHLRRFVLQPLAEIAPDLVLPGQTKTVAQLLAGLPDDGSCKKID